MDKKTFVGFAEEILLLEARSKDANASKLEAINVFAENNKLEKQSVKDSIKAYKAWLKDQAKFTLVDKEFSQIVNDVIYSKTSLDTVTAILEVE